MLRYKTLIITVGATRVCFGHLNKLKDNRLANKSGGAIFFRALISPNSIAGNPSDTSHLTYV